MAQIGGYDQNNATQDEYGFQLGKDFDFGASGKLSVDGIFTYDKGAVKSAALAAGSAAFADEPNTWQPPFPTTPAECCWLSTLTKS